MNLSACGQKPNTLTEAEAAEGWELLFDGTTLDGWRNFNEQGLTGWQVVDGAIQADGSGSDASGYIVTDREFENFHLSVDWSLSEGGNSGILYHVVERPEFAVPYVTGPEYQLIDVAGYEAASGEKLEDWQSMGVDYAMYLPSLEGVTINPPGEWNNSEIIFDNGHVEYWLNGVKTIEFEAWTDDWFARRDSGKWENAPEYGLAHRGLLCLQDHGYPASFRNVKVRELPRKAGREVSLFNGVDLKGWEPYGTELFYVEEGSIVLESGPDKGYGYLATREYYDDFDCTFEFNQVSDGNSGFFFHSVVFPEARVNGWQVEVAPAGKHSGGIYESYGRGWLFQPPVEHLRDGWNEMRVKALGDNVTVWLNGEEVTNLTDGAFAGRQGRIALQIHDGGGIKVMFRNLKLTTL
ncbi:MAG: DUF1080 domain-containing protein [Alistipes sp.]|nr:DUF1080 domain-containing protein [Alistipes sp.]